MTPSIEADLTAGTGRGDQAARLEASHELAQTWAHAVVDVSFALGERRVRIDTARESERERSAELWTVRGRIGGGGFAFEATRELLEAMLADLPDAVDLDALSPADAALVLEHVLSDALTAVERELGEPIEIEGVEADPLVTELEPILATVWMDRRRVSVRAVFTDPLHMRILTEWLRPMVMRDEFAAGEETRVEVGPIELSLDEFDMLEAGDAIAIGTEPGQNLVGRLVRATGRTVPVTIDTAQVIVDGPMQEAAPHDADADPIALGVAIGTVRMAPSHLVRARKGGRFIMERNADNACALMHGGDVMARGELTLIDGQLGVEIAVMGDGPMPAARSAPPQPTTSAPAAAAPTLSAPSPPAPMAARGTPVSPPGGRADVSYTALEPMEDDEEEALLPTETFRVGG